MRILILLKVVLVALALFTMPAKESKAQVDYVLLCEDYEGEVTVSFTKVNYADPNSESAQDIITPGVVLSRGSYRAPVNLAEGDIPGAACCGPPTGTLWKWGDFYSLNPWVTWREAVFQSGTGPNAALNSGNALMTMHIPGTTLYFHVEWHSWTPGNQGGGFSYTRTILIEESECDYVIAQYGCTNPNAENYTSEANVDDGSCLIGGCMNPDFCSFNPEANYDNGSCTNICPGCMNPEAFNYDPLATVDNGECTVLVCTYNGPKEVTFIKENYTSALIQYDEIFPQVRISRGGRRAPVNIAAGDIPELSCCGPPSNTLWKWGPTGSPGNYTNWRDAVLSSGHNIRNALANQLNGPPVMSLHIPAHDAYFDIEWLWWIPTNNGGGFAYKRTFRPEYSHCTEIAAISGCTDPNAANFLAIANLNDGNCLYPGCMNPDVCDFDPQANQDDGSCTGICNGCTIEGALNFDPNANTDDASCINVANNCSYDGPVSVYFEKLPMANPQIQSSRDQISEWVSITRNNNRSLYNYALEGYPAGCCGPNPVATLWKWGEHNNPEPYSSFRDAVIGTGFGMRAALSQGLAGPKIMTMYIPSEGWYFQVEFHSWSPGNSGGGFSYTRTFLPEISGCEIVETIPGCTDPEADNYNIYVNFDNGNCVYLGCTDISAINYDPDANTDNGSCITACEYPTVTFQSICIEEDEANYYVEVQISDLGNAAPYVLSDNQNSEELVVNFTGTLLLGPFDNNAVTLFELSSFSAPCALTSSLLSIDCMANDISELHTSSFALFPNPGNGRFSLRNGDTSFHGTLAIRDITGREIWSQRLSVEPGAIASIEPGIVLSPGTYLADLSGQGHRELLRFSVE